MNWYKLDLTYKFYEYKQKYCIKLFWLLSYSNYLISLLDISCFQLFQYYYLKTINDAIGLNLGDFKKFKFLAKFQFIHSQTFKKSIIKSELKNTWLIFYNFKIIFQKINTFSKSIYILTSLLLNSIMEITLIYAITT